MPPPTRPAAAPASQTPAPDESAAIAKFRELRESLETGTPRDIDAFVDYVTNYTFLNPNTAFSSSLKNEVPPRLKARADRAYAAGRPWRAFRLYQAFTRISRAPGDPVVEERLRELRERLQPRSRAPRPASEPAR